MRVTISETDEFLRQEEKKLKRANRRAHLFLAFSIVVFGLGAALSIFSDEWEDVIDYAIFTMWAAITYVLMLMINLQNFHINILEGARENAIRHIDELLAKIREGKK